MPRSNNSKANFRTISFEITNEKADELSQLALALGCYRSDIIRVAINNYLPTLIEENKPLLESQGISL